MPSIEFSIEFKIIAGVIGVVLTGLLVYIWGEMTERIKHLERWKEERVKMKILTEEEHEKICTHTWVEFKLYLDSKFENINLNIKNEIGEAVKQLNGNRD